MPGESAQRARHLKNKGPLMLAIFLTLCIYSVFCFAIWAVMQMVLKGERFYGILFLGALLGWVILLGLRMLVSRSCKCPLCHGQWIAARKCRMHDKARKYPFLKYRTSLMIDAIFRWNFRCQYCGTPYRLKR